MLRIVPVHKEGAELNMIRRLFREYEKELDADLCFQHFEEELANPLRSYDSLKGALLLAYWNEEAAGCIALKPMPAEEYCEMKRLYVRPAFRKYGIGNSLVHKVIEYSTQKRYRFMRLDTFVKLQSAVRLYKMHGFYEIGPYYHNPLPDVVFMEKKLASSIAD